MKVSRHTPGAGERTETMSGDYAKTVAVSTHNPKPAFGRPDAPLPWSDMVTGWPPARVVREHLAQAARAKAEYLGGMWALNRCSSQPLCPDPFLAGRYSPV